MNDRIYDQTQIPRDRWRYGFRSSAATGCGWIAVYNALGMLGYRASPESLIRYFQRQLPLIHGNFGTSLWGPALYFRRWGFPVKMTARRSRFDDLARESDACILFYRWRRGWRIGAHFVALERRDGNFVACNASRGARGPESCGPSLEAWLGERGYFGAILTGIRAVRTK